jgi:glycosyltransferase involved in cell wall biosynthesis
MKIVLTIPAYNEAKSIEKVISDVKAELSNIHHHSEILVVDDGSTDNTAAIAKAAGARVYSHPKNYGLAETFKTEMTRALEMGPDVIIHFDADGQYLARDIPKLVKEIESGSDLVLGSRFLGKIESMPLIKRIGNKMFSRVISNITGLRITDGQTGFRAFTKEVATKIRITSNHTYTQEQIIRAVKAKFKVTEVPVYFAKRRHGTSRLMTNAFGYAARAWMNLMRIYRDYEPLKFFGIIGLSFFGLGFLLGLFILYSFITTGAVGALPRVMLCILLMSLGIQIAIFGFLADMMNKD